MIRSHNAEVNSSIFGYSKLVWFLGLGERWLTKVIKAIEHIIACFREPLEAKGGDMSSIHDEVEKVV